MVAKREEQLILRCVVYPGKTDNKSGYYATCIDLNLFTWRPTIKEAEKSLNDAIQGYLEVVNEIAKDGNDCRNLIPRRASFWPHRLRYHLIALRLAIPNTGSNHDSILFEEPVNMPCFAAA